MDDEASIGRELANVTDGQIGNLLNFPRYSRYLEKHPNTFDNRWFYFSKYETNREFLQKYGKYLKKVEYEIRRDETIDAVRKFMFTIPNVVNLKIENDHQIYWYNSGMIELHELGRDFADLSWLIRLFIHVDHFMNQKPPLKHLESLDFKINSFGSSTFSALVSSLLGADQLKNLAICIPAEAKMDVFKQFLFNQQRLENLAIQGFCIDEIFQIPIPRTQFRLKRLEIFGKFEEFGGFNSFLKVQNEIEVINFSKVRCRHKEAIFTHLKNLKQLVLSDRAIRRNSSLYKKIMNEEYKLLKLEQLVIFNRIEKNFPLEKVLIMFPNLKILEVARLTLNHSSFLAKFQQLERLSIKRFNPVTLYNVANPSLKIFVCNDINFQAAKEVWENFMLLHPNLELLFIGNFHMMLASVKRELQNILPYLKHLKKFRKFYFESSTKSLLYEIGFGNHNMDQFDNQFVKIGIFRDQRIININYNFQVQFPDILSRIVREFPTFHLTYTELPNNIMGNHRYFPRIY